MRFYNSIASQTDMDQLLASIAGFHDSMTKEIHLVNRGFVRPGGAMMTEHRYDAQVLIQSQWEPFAIELLFSGIQELNLGDPGWYWGASGRVEVITSPVEKRRITMTFDSELTIVSESLWFRVRSNWLGQEAFLTSNVPGAEAVAAQTVDQGWRQCSACNDAWKVDSSSVFSHCPSCGRLTELISDGA